ncbi:Serine/threonine-protein phosphatase PP-X like protein 3 [Astathelohania contejeani]|uniref:Serine/threonine-protein phosphatase n=1 Tax=Astathelohania contejeani TaxID=164912 RepID=A0ABQ7HYB2_9MICR|nr:Serine/threonine-protein phosphatase PP-X like protein 3 [Thelohania contejeani]
MDIKNLILELKNSKLPTLAEAFYIINISSSLFFNEPNLLRLETPVTIVGDIHGQFYDLLNMFELVGQIPQTNYLFLGDYVDRGYNSVETILLLLLLKIQYPNSIFMIRGNHETQLLSSTYGFKDECLKKYNTVFYLKICELFQLLPVAALIKDRIFAVHGGISPDINLKDIDKIDRVNDITKLSDLMWSDPYDENGFHVSPRGAGILFGEDVTNIFLEKNGIEMIVRSHQLVYEGFKVMFGGKVVVVWSAPNYCYRCGNMASVMNIKKDGRYDFIIYDRCDKQILEEQLDLEYF